VPKIYPPGKGKGVPHRPPKIEPKPEIDRTMRYLAAKDEWHALTHHGEAGTEVVQALKSSSGWAPASTNWATHARSEPPAVSRASSSAPSTSVATPPH
jgi:hypothetical protein